MWLCLCDCGNTVVASSNNIQRGITKSCGCYHSDKMKENIKLNEYKFDGDIVIGITSNTGNEFLIDKEDCPKVSEHTWLETDQGYIITHIEGRNVRLHRFILDIYDDRMVDHINRNKRDNRKSNLRIVTKQQNSINRIASKKSKTGIKGVSLLPNGMYIARIMKDGKNIHLGCYQTIDEAKYARGKAEIELFGEFACLDKKVVL